MLAVKGSKKCTLGFFHFLFFPFSFWLLLKVNFGLDLIESELISVDYYMATDFACCD